MQSIIIQHISKPNSVPQGSILGSLQFILSIIDLHLFVKQSKIHNFADGINLLFNNKVTKNINAA